MSFKKNSDGILQKKIDEKSLLILLAKLQLNHISKLAINKIDADFWFFNFRIQSHLFFR